ncbi:MAG: 5-formyltetrahydrofolate cyclo-ligase [Ignavibacteriales bacterium CG_4_9_14_3_um_filter_34_10]|nr:MAG: 5-formyltetrahydrofolate cyclo-ligase [Ignavibacteriales bacterium CG_4_9_14_3_um_filter_34_10]
MKLKPLIPKSEARKIVVKRRSELSAIEIRNKTKTIVDLLKTTDDFIHSTNIFCYVASMPGEVDTKILIDQKNSWGKNVFLPKLNRNTKSFRRFHFTGWDELIKNSDGYWEPKYGTDDDMSDIDLIIVPALAVSKSGQRVGYGGGYYDKLLQETFAPKYVLVFEFQLFEYIETSTHDIRMDKIITERRIINPRKSIFSITDVD